MAFILKGEGVTVLLMNRPQPYGETPNARVQIGALACLDAGTVDELIIRCRDRIESLGAMIVFEKVSRFDPKLDIADVPVGDFVTAYRSFHMVTRAKKGTEYDTWNGSVHTQGRRSTGFTLGCGVHLRVYDKTHELKSDAVKRAAWSQAQWGGRPPEVCTRVEFQLRRTEIKSFEIHTLDDLRDKLASVVNYLVTKWFRITTTTPDERNPQRTPTSDLWNKVIEGFRGRWGNAVNAVRRTLRKVCDRDSMVRMARGCMESVAGFIGKRIDELDDFVGFMCDQFYQADHGDHDFFDAVRRKRIDYESRCPVDPIIMEGGLS